MPQFTSRARKALQLANREAQRMNHEYIGTEHLLLGLIAEGGGVACAALRRLGLDPARVRSEVLARAQAGPDMITMGTLPQTPRAKRCIEFAIAEAARAGRPVGTGELLLGVLMEQEGLASQVLLNLGILKERTLDDVRRVVDAESLRAEDDAPADSLRLGADVSGRQRLLWKGLLRGALTGLFFSVPVTTLCAVLLVNLETPLRGQWDLVLAASAFVVLVWTGIAAAMGARRGREDSMPPEHREIIRRSMARSVKRAAVFAVPVTIILVVAVWRSGPDLALLDALLLLGVWLGSAAGVGYIFGIAEVSNAEEREGAAVERFLRSGDSGTLTQRRRALETAIEAKFGPLGDSERERIRAWDEGRVAEAVRRLPDAARVEDLDP
jgi:hypothetical protein